MFERALKRPNQEAGALYKAALMGWQAAKEQGDRRCHALDQSAVLRGNYRRHQYRLSGDRAACSQQCARMLPAARLSRYRTATADNCVSGANARRAGTPPAYAPRCGAQRAKLLRPKWRTHLQTPNARGDHDNRTPSRQKFPAQHGSIRRPAAEQTKRPALWRGGAGHRGTRGWRGALRSQPPTYEHG